MRLLLRPITRAVEAVATIMVYVALSLFATYAAAMWILPNWLLPG